MHRLHTVILDHQWLLPIGAIAFAAFAVLAVVFAISHWRHTSRMMERVNKLT